MRTFIASLGALDQIKRHNIPFVNNVLLQEIDSECALFEYRFVHIFLTWYSAITLVLCKSAQVESSQVVNKKGKFITYIKNMVRYKILQPSLVRFTTQKIQSTFDNGLDCNTTLQNILKGSTNPENVAPMRVFNLKGIYYTCDNRRLYVFRAAQYFGALDYISVIVASPCDFDLSIISPDREGKIIEFQNKGQVFPHWSDEWTFSPKVGRKTVLKRTPSSPRDDSVQHFHSFQKDSQDDEKSLLDMSQERKLCQCCVHYLCCFCQSCDDL
ncbi:uncharacterized protein LOC120348066 isoform X2 [Styela clava]